MGEMELMCDRVGIITNGVVIGVKTIDELLRDASGSEIHYVVKVNDAAQAIRIIGTLDNYNACDTNRCNLLDETTLELSLCATDEQTIKISEINKALILEGIELETVTVKDSKKLEDAFIEITSEGGDQIA